jgi:hypothetical protein
MAVEDALIARDGKTSSPILHIALKCSLDATKNSRCLLRSSIDKFTVQRKHATAFSDCSQADASRPAPQHV